MLPSDFPKYGIVRYYYDGWSEERAGRYDAAFGGLKKIVTLLRNDDLRGDKTTLGIIDAQSVRNADTAGEKGYGAGKKCPASNGISWLTREDCRRLS
jgi:hypothetical protein